MPKPTFANLPPAKRQAIIDLAIAEFAEHPYAIASLSRIVERAGIAKGSIYQYFEHKQDLYLFLLEYAAQRQLELLRAQAPSEPPAGFFAMVRWQMRVSIQVGLAAPVLTRLMYRAVTDDLPFREEVTRRLGAASETHLQQLIAAATARGELNAALDGDLVVFVVRQLTTQLHDVLVRRLGLTLEAAAGDVTLLNDPLAEQLYDQVVQILQYGLSPRPDPAHDERGAQ